LIDVSVGDDHGDIVVMCGLTRVVSNENSAEKEAAESGEQKIP
jgi:hypothetical protein